jgi:mRNA interferase MazF
MAEDIEGTPLIVFSRKPLHQVKGYPFEVALPKGTGVSGVILADQIKSLDWKSRNAEFNCNAPYDVVNLVIEKLATLLS